MLDVLLLNPLAVLDGRRVHFQRDWCGGEVPTSINYPPIDLAHAAALLRERGFQVGLLDASALGLGHDEVVRRVALQRPRIIGLASAWGSFRDDVALAARLREAVPDALLAVSGPHVTTDPEFALDHTAFDVVVHGELEAPYLALARGEEASADNLSVRGAAGGVQSSPRRLMPDLDLPYPARDLLPLSRYRNPYTARNPFTMMWASRGCPYRCNFCQVNTWYLGKVRFRSVEHVLGEIEEVRRRFGIPDIVFKDHTFTLKRPWVMEICEGIVRRDLDVTWRCFATVDTVDRELLTSMRNAGCTQLCFGFESGNQRVLDQSGKGTTLDQGRNAMRLARELGIEVAGTFMLGMLGDDAGSIDDTIRFALALDVDYAQFAIPMATPPTPLYEHYVRRTGRRTKPLDYRWHSGSTMHNPDLPGELLKRELRRAYRTFYLRPGYLWERLRRIRGPRDLWAKAGTAFKILTDP